MSKNMFFPFYFAGGLLSGICKTRVEPTAFRLLCEVNGNNAGGLSSVYVRVYDQFLCARIKCCFVEQKMVDEADPFPEVLQRVVAWLQERELGTKYKYAILTDGYV